MDVRLWIKKTFFFFFLYKGLFLTFLSSSIQNIFIFPLESPENENYSGLWIIHGPPGCFHLLPPRWVPIQLHSSGSEGGGLLSSLFSWLPLCQGEGARVGKKEPSRERALFPGTCAEGGCISISKPSNTGRITWSPNSCITNVCEFGVAVYVWFFC